MMSTSLFARRAAFVSLFGHLAIAAQAPLHAAANGQSMGFVVTTWNIASYETRFVDECPRGLNVGYDEHWWRGLSKEDRALYTDNGLKSRLERYFNAIRRGPNGEDVCMNGNRRHSRAAGRAGCRRPACRRRR